MKSVDQLIVEAREFTNNTSYSETSGISQLLCVKFLNEGQEQLQASIINQFPQEFVKETVIQVVSGQEKYAIPTDAFGGGRILSVFYSQTGQDRDYVRLPPRTLLERDQRQSNYPSFYIRASNSIYLNPIPLNSSGTIKVQYYYSLPKLAVTNYKVNPALNNPPTNSFVLFASPPVVPPETKFLSIFNEFGVAIFKDAIIGSPPVTGNQINLTAPLNTFYNNPLPPFSWTLDPFWRLTFGKGNTPVAQMPDSCERYLSTYLQKRMLSKDVNDSAFSEDRELRDILATILIGYGQPTEDVYSIPIIDGSLL